MLNFYLRQWGQAHRLTPTFIIEPIKIEGAARRSLSLSVWTDGQFRD